VTRFRRSPRPIGIALDQARSQWEPETLLAEVQRVWSEAVGDVIAGEARPTGERGGVVTISCSASVWAQELDLMSPTIVDRLNTLLGGARVDRLRCVAATPNDFSRG